MTGIVPTGVRPDAVLRLLGRNPDEGLIRTSAVEILARKSTVNGNFVQAEMVKAFISSIEYRERLFVQPWPRLTV